jgi:tetratricopeptide (TPR) repeat protein
MESHERKIILEAARSLATLEHDYEGALQRVEQILAENPDDIDALMFKGNILDLDHKHQEALRCYRYVLDIDPDNVAALIDMGDCYSWLDAYEQAIGFFDRALEFLRQGRFYLNPQEECKSAYLGKILALRESGRLEEASNCEREAEAECQRFRLG